MIACDAQEHIRVHEFALVPHLLVLIQAREGTSLRGPAAREGIGSLTMRDAAIPVQIGAAGFSKRRHQGAQLGVNSTAVVALVVILAKNLPIRGNFVAQGGADAQLRQRIALQSLRNTFYLSGERFGLRWRQIQEDEPAPAVGADGVKVVVLLSKSGGRA